jgi:heme exporter protein A
MSEEAALRGLTVNGLVVERGGRRVLDGLSFSLAPGGLLALTGANGAGKSTLLRALAGLVAVADGRIAALPNAADVIENTHYLGHSDAFKGTLSVVENLAFWQAVLQAPGASVPLSSVLARLGLGALADLPAIYLSAGQRRRLALARLLAAPRALWLLDEPTNALDADGQALLDELLADHLGVGGLAIVATHAKLARATAELRLGPAAA